MDRTAPRLFALTLAAVVTLAMLLGIDGLALQGEAAAQLAQAAAAAPRV